MPTFFYGTAWKEQATTELVSMALAAGFRGIDTANQRRHYDEDDPSGGTTNPAHMREDLGVYDFDLAEDDLRTLAAGGL